jgi:hypothetical protein
VRSGRVTEAAVALTRKTSGLAGAHVFNSATAASAFSTCPEVGAFSDADRSDGIQKRVPERAFCQGGYLRSLTFELSGPLRRSGTQRSELKRTAAGGPLE